LEEKNMISNNVETELKLSMSSAEAPAPVRTGTPGRDNDGTTNETLVGVQLLRGIAALLVVFQHYVLTAAERGFAIPALTGIWIGHAGVDIFFVISGFIMEYTCGGKKYAPGDRRTFITRRLIRILPLYWTLTLFAAAVAMLLPGAVNAKITLHEFLMSMVMLPGIDGNGRYEYVITMAWTLTYEFYFYIIFCILLAATPRTRLLSMAAIFGLGAIVHMFHPSPQNTIVAVFSSPLAFEFLAGCVLARLLRAGISLSALSSFSLIAVGITVLFFELKMEVVGSWMRVVQWGVPGALLVYGTVLCRGWVQSSSRSFFTALFEHIGNISYSLYLSHFFGIALFVRLYAMIAKKMTIAPWLAGLCLFAFCILVAQICYVFIEKPARSALQARFFPKRLSAVNAAPEHAVG
jgi:exopolysaccharide production protein ExoZ